MADAAADEAVTASLSQHCVLRCFHLDASKFLRVLDSDMD
jgi:hypothetical protein